MPFLRNLTHLKCMLSVDKLVFRKNNLEATRIMYFDAIAKIISERTGCDVSTIKPESKIFELGIDSLDTVELLMNLEDEIGIEIDLDEKVDTIDDLDKFIQKKTAAAGIQS